MTQEKTGATRGCFKGGCLGCLGLLLLAALAVAAIVATSRFHEPDPRSQEIVQELPAVAHFPLESGPSSLVPGEGPVGRVRLAISAAQIDVVPGQPGDPIRVEADYDGSVYSLAERFTEQENGDWEFELRFAPRAGFLSLLLHPDRDQSPRVVLLLPPDWPLELGGEVSTGASYLELGGLSITQVSLELGAGDHSLSFHEPTPEPVSLVELDASMGSLRVDGLGNASPDKIRIKSRAGEVRIDLRGDWRGDSDVGIRCGLGECRIRVPDDVGLDIDDLSVTFGDKQLRIDQDRVLPPEAPRLTLSVHALAGEVQIKD